MQPSIVLVEPSLEETAEAINRYHGTHVVVVHAACKVHYEGRARSELEGGARLIVTKPDGSLLVHGRTKREPINWQPPGCKLYASVKGGVLCIRSERRSPPETITIECWHVYALMASLCDEEEGQFKLWGDEGSMVEEVLERPELIEPGFKPLQREFRTPFGTIDLVGMDSRGRLVALEFKRSTAQLESVSQLKRYVDYLSRHGEARGILVAPSLSEGASRLLREYGLEHRRLAPPVKE